MSPLEPNLTKKGGVYKNNTMELDYGDNRSKEYKVKAIQDSIDYTRKSKSSYLPGLYYLIF